MLEHTDYFTEHSIRMREPLLYSCYMDGVDRKAKLTKLPTMKDFLLKALDNSEFRLKLEKELKSQGNPDRSHFQDKGADNGIENEAVAQSPEKVRSGCARRV